MQEGNEENEAVEFDVYAHFTQRSVRLWKICTNNIR